MERKGKDEKGEQKDSQLLVKDSRLLGQDSQLLGKDSQLSGKDSQHRVGQEKKSQSGKVKKYEWNTKQDKDENG